MAGRLWVRFDVFDRAEMPAVAYPRPGGLSRAQVRALLRPLAASLALVGTSMADFVPDKDPDGNHVLRLTELVARVIT